MSIHFHNLICTRRPSILKRLLIYILMKWKQQSSTAWEKWVIYREVSLLVALIRHPATIRHAMTHWCWKTFMLTFILVWCFNKLKNRWLKNITEKTIEKEIVFKIGCIAFGRWKIFENSKNRDMITDIITDPRQKFYEPTNKII